MAKHNCRGDERSRPGKRLSFDKAVADMTAEDVFNEITTILGAKPANTLISAIKEIAEFVRHLDDQAHASAPRTAVRETLLTIAAAADVVAAVLDDNERSTTFKLGHTSASPIHPGAASGLGAPASADAAGWGGPSPQSFETVNDKGLKVTLTMKYPRTVVERGRALRAS